MAAKVRPIKSDLSRIDKLRDEDIDYSEIPELDEGVFAQPLVQWPPRKAPITIRVDADVLKCRFLNGRYGWTLTDWHDTGVPARYQRVLTLLARLPLAACLPGPWRSRLPTSLSDEEFQAITTGFSESAGPFPHSENLVSNEGDVARLARMLRPRGGVYIGVGPEQNFSYIVRLRPDIAFIVDIRAENRSLHLLYKALFELSLDRADFVSRLFSRQRPVGLGAGTSVEDLFAAYSAARSDERLYRANGKLIR